MDAISRFERRTFQRGASPICAESLMGHGKRVIVHIGWEKTGTSALQAFCNRNRAWLAERGVSYPAIGRHAQHLQLYFDLASGRADRVARARRACQAAIEASDAHTVVFSHESLHECSPGLFRQVIGDEHEIQIVAYIREPVEQVVSFFVTRLRFGQVAPWPLLTAVRGHLQISGRFHDPMTSLTAFINTFGPDAVTTKLFDQSALQDVGIVPDFLSVLGIHNLEGSKWPEARANPSLDGDQFGHALRVAHRYRLDAKQFWKFCDGLLEHTEPDRQRPVVRFVPASLRNRIDRAFGPGYRSACRELAHIEPPVPAQQSDKVAPPSPHRVDAITNAGTKALFSLGLT